MDEENNEQSTVNSLGDQQQNSKEKLNNAKNNANNSKVGQAIRNAVKTFVRTHIVQICIAAGAVFFILIIIGILQVLLSMPGMILGKLKEFGQTLLNKIVGYYTGNNISVSKEDEIELAQYIQDMGYDVVGYGFANAEYETNEETNGATGIENSTIKNVEGINGRNYIQQYLVQNEAIYTPSVWSWKGYFEQVGGLRGDIADSSVGMINISTDIGLELPDPVNNFLEGVEKWASTLASKYSIDAERKVLVVKENARWDFWNSSEYYFDMSNWTSKYGKPIELFLALHLSTMMPDLAYDLATNDAFNTKVNIEMKKSTVTYDSVTWNETTYTKNNIEDSIKQIDSDIDKVRSNADLTEEEQNEQIDSYQAVKNKLKEIQDLVGMSHEVNWPYISSVTKHWFYNNINFEDTYGYTGTQTQPINYTLQDGEDVIINATLHGGMFYQLTDPEPEGPNEAIVALFQGGNDAYKEFTGTYYRYDGTRARAKEIEEAKKSGTSQTVFKEPVTFINENGNSYKNAFSAFAILQNSKTEEAEECYRCLKKLLVTLKYFEEDELKDLFKQVLDWFMPDNKKEENIVKDTNKYGIIVKDSKGKSIEAPGDGEIIASSNDTITIKFAKVNSDKLKELKDKYGKEYSIQDNILVDMEMVISGITPSVSQGQQVKLGDSLGEGAEDEVQVYMKYSDGSIVDDVRTYMDTKYAQGISGSTSGGTVYNWQTEGRFGLRDELATPYASGNENSIKLYTNPQKNPEAGKTGQGTETWYNPDAPSLAGIYALVRYVANNTKYDGPCVLALREDNIWTLDGYVMVAADPDYFERGDFVNTNYGPGLVCDAVDISNDFDIATTWLLPDGHGGYKHDF